MTDTDDVDSPPVPDDLLPLESDDISFDAPWQARAFALAVALYDRSNRDWDEFQRRLVDNLDDIGTRELNADVENVYYREWLKSLQELAVEKEILSQKEFDRRKEEFSEGRRDASEFVDSDPDH